jgi:hypothetical protein
LTVLSLVPFPPLLWWQKAFQSPTCLLDAAEPFRKMGYRNRYRLASSNGPLWLTIPIIGGREQRRPVHQIAIDNRLPWQRNHWRSLTSIYRRTPFFDHYEPLLKPLFTTAFDHLAPFNEASIRWCSEALDLSTSLSVAQTLPDVFEDVRESRLSFADPSQPSYAQPFMERTGFLPGMSILDVLFCEGPAASNRLR